MPNIITALGQQDFDAAIKQDRLVVVDFWAPWCKFCTIVTPILQEVANEYAEKIAVFAVNVEEQEVLAEKCGIMGLPAIFLYKNGSVVKRMSGLLTKQQITDAIQQHIS